MVKSISRLCLLMLIQAISVCHGWNFELFPQEPHQYLNDMALACLEPIWDVLGPFQIGTRELAWGSDPLERLGGFRALHYDTTAEFSSSLSVNGTIKWTRMSTSVEETTAGCKTTLKVSFPDVDWKFQTAVSGWLALQYQAWVRGILNVVSKDSVPIVISLDHAVEFWIDDHAYFGGDLYGFHRAPSVINLTPGPHKLDIRLVYDVRAMGAVGNPLTKVHLQVQVVSSSLAVVEGSLLAPDIVEEELASELGSVTVRNNGLDRIMVSGLLSLNDNFNVSLSSTFPIEVAPGQSRPLAFVISLDQFRAEILSFKITYQRENFHEMFDSQFSYSLHTRSRYEPHKITYWHPAGIVSYSILRAPLSSNCNSSKLPILLNLHGAGLDADSEELVHAFDPLPNLQAWVLFPSGVTSWSGDDWHLWGFADVEAGIRAIQVWIQKTHWNGTGVDVDKWLVTGHSNGGQGVWYALTHFPDKIIAAAPISGYMSIEAYVPYTHWHETEPLLSAVLSNSRGNYKHELLMSNFAGIPVLQQHGRKDDNVPVYHSRRMHELSIQVGWATQYTELPAAGHWFDGVLTTPPLCAFYEKYLEEPFRLPNLPIEFTITIPPCGATISRGGIVVDQLESPDQQGSIKIRRLVERRIWHLRTANIRRFHVSHLPGRDASPRYFKLDDMKEAVMVAGESSKNNWFVKSPNGTWMTSIDRTWLHAERYGRQLGPLEGILQTSGRLMVISCANGTNEIALSVANNLYQYFGADVEISQSTLVNADNNDDEPLFSITPKDPGNIISISIGVESLPPDIVNFPISIRQSGLVVKDHDGAEHLYRFRSGLGAIYLRPMSAQKLEMVLWGYDEDGLRKAARLVPMLTGSGQPDFIVVEGLSSWKGASGGVIAAGFFDYTWKPSKASFFTSLP